MTSAEAAGDAALAARLWKECGAVIEENAPIVKASYQNFSM